MMIGLSVLRRPLFEMNYLLYNFNFSDNLNIFKKRLETFLFNRAYN